MESRGRRFVRSLPSAAISPVVVIPDTTPTDEREDLLNAMAEEGSVDPFVAQVALWLAERCAARLDRAPTDRDLQQALLDGLHELSQYGDDPERREEYNRAITTLLPARGSALSPVTGAPKGQGDCEDLAVLYVALCLAIGLSARVIWMDQPSANMNHVATVVCGSDGACAWVETTLPGALVGRHPYAEAARLGNTATLGMEKR